MDKETVQESEPTKGGVNLAASMWNRQQIIRPDDELNQLVPIVTNTLANFDFSSNEEHDGFVIIEAQRIF